MTDAHFITDGGGGDNSPCPRPRGAETQRRLVGNWLRDRAAGPNMEARDAPKTIFRPCRPRS